MCSRQLLTKKHDDSPLLAQYSISNTWVKLGSAKIRAMVKHSFIIRNAAFALSVHGNLLPFIHFVSGAIILLKC